MLFSSMSFIFVFLPVVLLLYLTAKKELYNFILLIASIIFYAWAEPNYLAIMLLTIIINYFGALVIDKYNHYKKFVLILTIIADLGFLIYFKYFNFIIDNCNNLFHLHINILQVVMPVGISFYTFQAISYVIDVYKGECRVQKDIYKLALFICLFPQLIAGPILKYHDAAEQIENRVVNFEKVDLGVKRFIIGLSKKMLIANTIGVIADKIFIQDPHTFSSAVAWLGAFSYSFQLYFDFSGYSDMALGLGLIFGFKFPQNFNYPYISKSVTEFWRRWHISLSTWFKQYVYIPLGGNRNGMINTIRNLGLVFLLTGIWHGAAWNFVIWGIWHGFFIIIEKIINIKEFEQKHRQNRIKFLQHTYCILVFVIGWVIFRADSIKYAYDYICNMFCLVKHYNVAYDFPYYAGGCEAIIFAVAVICCMPLFSKILDVKNKIGKAFINIWLLFLFVFSVAAIASDTYNPFIYFRF